MKRMNQLQTSLQLLCFTITWCVLLQNGIAQISSGHIDDFQNLNVSGWTEGAFSPNQPVVVNTGGPAGDDDAFLRNVSSGGMGAGGKWVMFNQSVNWIGNYIAAGVIRISIDVRNTGSQNVHMRIAFNGPGGTISSSAVFTVVPDTVWQSIEFVIDPQAFIPLMAGGDATMTLSAVNEFRILSNPMPDNVGAEIVATVDIDNIHAEGISAINDPSMTAWTVYPNPATDQLQLFPNKHDDAVSITLLNPLGHVLMHQTLFPPYQLEIGHLPGGMFFLIIDEVSVIRVLAGK
ncbi:MAG TPA: T9SS type A sorting domain-containing protein [Saprospiraceae bacterium]|nr:T9SS type A sorting domain-containing protein [Saprospiraceae bacterium]